MDIANMIADDLDYSGDSRYPKISGIRNLRRVLSDKHSQGYSFVFEACLNGEWNQYGPDVNGNWTVRSDCSFRFPEEDMLYAKNDTTTVRIGWHKLNQMSSLPLSKAS